MLHRYQIATERRVGHEREVYEIGAGWRSMDTGE